MQGRLVMLNTAGIIPMFNRTTVDIQGSPWEHISLKSTQFTELAKANLSRYGNSIFLLLLSVQSSTMSSIPLSVVIITFNESGRILQCLESVRTIADEIIVLDSLSTDDTCSLAATAGASVYSQAFKGYGIQKNDAVRLASHTWVLSLDADEVLTPELAAEILAFKNGVPQADAYTIPRLNNYLGKWLHHGGWYPDAKIRLFNRTKGSWKTLSVHEFWEPLPGAVTGKFTHDMLHYTMATFQQQLLKIEKYTELSARYAVQRGKKVSLLKALLVPHWTFFQRFVLRAGFLDGYEGYLMCKMAAIEKWLKYHKTRKYTAEPATG